MSQFEVLIIVVFAIFILWVIFKPEKVLQLQIKVYKMIGIEMNYSKKAVYIIRVIGIFVLLLGAYGLYKTVIG